MVKGCQRKMVCLKQTESEWFEEAYFILREEKQTHPCDEESLLKEADRIVCRQSVGKRGKSHLRLGERVLWFALGAVCSFVICWAVFWM